MTTGLRTLVLNSNYMPISLFPLHTIPAEDAVTRVFNGTCHIVSEYDRDVLSPNIVMKWPAVIARNDHDMIKTRVALLNESLFYRDHGMCAYCENPLTPKSLTFDHVIPRSKGGGNGWDNIVASCSSCNTRKGHNMPIGEWKPKFDPYIPTYFDILKVRRNFPITVDHESWAPFLGAWKGEINIRNVAA